MGATGTSRFIVGAVGAITCAMATATILASGGAIAATRRSPAAPATPAVSPSHAPSPSPSPAASLRAAAPSPSPSPRATMPKLGPSPSPSPSPRPSPRPTAETVRPLRFEGAASISHASPDLGGASSFNPSLMLWGIEARPLYLVARVPNPALLVYAGASFDYRFVGQYSDVSPVVGSFRGSQLLLLSPTVALFHPRQYFGEVQLIWLGSYSLANPTVTGGQVSYGSPLGFSATASYAVGDWFAVPGLYAGLRLEYLKFGSRSVTPVAAASAGSLSLGQLGFVVSYVY